MNSLLLVDSSIVYDLRIQRNYNYDYIFRCKGKSSSFVDLIFLIFLSLKNIKFLKYVLDIPYKYIFKGINKPLKYFSIDKDIKYMGNDIKKIIANDFQCGILGMKLKKQYPQIYFIYDSHEIQFNRMRDKNSLFRMFLEMSIENEVIKYADEVRVVNQPIKKLYQELYNIDETKIIVVNNNHFECYQDYYRKNFLYDKNNIAILYIGAGIKGRLLDKLAEESKNNIPVYGFFLQDIPKEAIDNGWYIGQKKYLDEVKELIKQKTFLMWCVNDISCLSYKLALPNKFFQAVSLSIPVIAYKGTYLAEIVERHDIGYLYDNNLGDIIKKVQNKDKFFKIIENMNRFQELICDKKLML